MSTLPSVPMYLDAMLAAWHAGHASRAIHFGFWPSPPSAEDLREPDAFARAQARLDAVVLVLAGVEAGCRVLDVGCGQGSTLEALDFRTSPLAMTGVNIDGRQLAACRALQPRAGSAMTWVLADACELPFAPGSFDRVLCVEAIFHFRARAAFLAEAGRVLAPGGSLVLTDLRARRAGMDAAARREDALLEQEVTSAFGPWPEFWTDDTRPLPPGGTLVLVDRLDLTFSTLPTHAFTAAPGPPAADPLARACQALARLHGDGRLAVIAERYLRHPP